MKTDIMFEALKLSDDEVYLSVVTLTNEHTIMEEGLPIANFGRFLDIHLQGKESNASIHFPTNSASLMQLAHKLFEQATKLKLIEDETVKLIEKVYGPSAKNTELGA